ncbi:MAG TPA: glycosyltransferase [Thermoanaerobaculia bacterium]|nr:glycosyltransferase [Thermoanaerobaculia bacterium]
MRLLLVTSRYPWPPRRGDQVRTVQQLDFLAGAHEVTLLTPEPGPDRPAPAVAGASFLVETYRLGAAAAVVGIGRALLDGSPLQSGLFRSPDLGRKLRALAPRHDLAILQLVRLALHLDDVGATPVLADLIDSLALNFERRAALDRSSLRPLLRLEARRLAHAERRLVERAAGALVVSERDRRAVAAGLPEEQGRKLSVVPLAVEGSVLAAPAEGRPLLALTGNLGYFPNADAAAWWLAEVWPALRARRPEVRVVVAGDRPGRAVRRAVARAGSGVELMPSPPDLGALLRRATLALAPLRCGSGLPIKVLEAWAAEVPVVASPWAAAGTTCRPGEDLRLAERPAEWVEAVLGLLDDPAERQRLAAAGRRRLAADYAPAVVRERLLASVEAAVAAA